MKLKYFKEIKDKEVKQFVEKVKILLYNSRQK